MSTFYRRDQDPHPVACVFFIMAWAVTGFFIWDLLPGAHEKIIETLGGAIGTTLYFGICAVVSLLFVSLVILCISALADWFGD